MKKAGKKRNRRVKNTMNSVDGEFLIRKGNIVSQRLLKRH